MSLRGRLLTVVLVIVSAILVVSGAITYAAVATSLESHVDQQLSEARARAARGLFRRPFETAPGGQAVPNPTAPGATPSTAPPAPGSFPIGLPRELLTSPEPVPGMFAEVVAPDGDVIASSSDTNPRFASVAAGGTVPQGSFATTRSSEGARYRLLVSPSRDGGVLLIGAPTGPMDATLHFLLLVLMLASLALIGVVAATGLWLLGIGLRPLTRMAGAADKIAGGDLSKRVDPAEPGTEIGRLGLALNAMLERIEAAFLRQRESEDQLRRFVADASHELRTPLTSIRGYAELFRRGADRRPEDLATSMRRIEEESKRMGVLVDELLLLARLDEGRPLERVPVDLGNIVDDAVDTARVLAPRRRLELDLAGEPVVVEGDAVRLRQVVDNLLTNARVHTPSDAVTRVHLSTDPVTSSAVLEITDSGPGVAPDILPHLFERFYRVEASRSREHGGAGLGLAIVAAIVHAHGGEALASSVQPHGLMVKVQLPLAAAGSGTVQDERVWMPPDAASA